MGDAKSMRDSQTAEGTLFWFTGLSGAGKTTIGRKFYERIKMLKSNVLFLDGDELRSVLGDIHAHSSDERRSLALSYSRLCRMLVLQGMDVVCCTISMFHEVQAWNRANVRCYKEIYLKVPLEVLQARDSKGIYRRALEGQIKNVVGMDIPIEEPESPDIVIRNDGKSSVDDIVELLLSKTGAGNRIERGLG